MCEGRQHENHYMRINTVTGRHEGCVCPSPWLPVLTHTLTKTYTHTQNPSIIHSLECVTKLFIVINCLFCAIPLLLYLWVCVWESAQDPSHRSGALRLLIAHTNRLVIHVLPFMALFPAARGECLPPQVGSARLASPVPRGRNRRLIGAPGCAVILLWKVFQAASQYWFFWAGGKWRRPPSEALELERRRRQVEIEGEERREEAREGSGEEISLPIRRPERG